VALHEDRGILGSIASTAQHQQIENEPDKTLETGHAPDPRNLRTNPLRQHKYPAQHPRTDIRHPQVPEWGVVSSHGELLRRPRIRIQSSDGRTTLVERYRQQACVIAIAIAIMGNTPVRSRTHHPD